MNPGVASRLACVVLAAASSAVLADVAGGVKTAQNGDDTKEPVLEFTLDHDGTTTPLILDQSTQLKTAQGDVAVTLHMKPSRTLKVAGVSFEYPAAFTFSFDGADAANPDWALEGHDLVVRLSRLSKESDPSKAASSLIATLLSEKHGSKDKPSRASLVTKNSTLEGYKGTFKDGEETVLLEAYGFKAKGVVHVLFIQDGPNDGGQEGKDHNVVMKLLKDSLRIEK